MLWYVFPFPVHVELHLKLSQRNTTLLFKALPILAAWADSKYQFVIAESVLPRIAISLPISPAGVLAAHTLILRAESFL